MSDIRSFYRNTLERTRKEVHNLKRQTDSIVVARLVLFLLLIVSFYAAWRWGSWLLTGSLLLVALFLFSVKRHLLTSRLLRNARIREEVCQEELAALDGEFKTQNPSVAAADRHPFAHDLDLFGEGGLYHALNRASTSFGKQAVGEHMLQAPVTPAEMNAWHTALKELADEPEWLIRVQATAREVEDRPELIRDMLQWNHSDRSLPRIAKGLVVAAPIYAAMVFGLYAFDVIPLNLLFGLFLIPVAVAAYFLRHTRGIYEATGKQSAVFTALSRLLNEALTTSFNASRVKGVQEGLTEAREAFRQLARITEAFDQRNNLLVAIVTNALYLAELRNASKAEKWRVAHGSKMEGWLEAIGQLELMVSLGVWTANGGNRLCLPEVLSTPGISAKELRHPLMMQGDFVANDLVLTDDRQVMILTGANMAGKSTYLRTVGTNVLLARMGAPVVAASFALSDLRLFTSMRAADSLGEGTSYFMAELLRLSQLMEESTRQPPVLALLDEILRGTNSVDKEKGSHAFVERLLESETLALVATHDVSLCKLSETHPGRVFNRHFASEVSENDLSFDYKLREGVCDTMNATYLMRKMGILRT